MTDGKVAGQMERNKHRIGLCNLLCIGCGLNDISGDKNRTCDHSVNDRLLSDSLV